MKNITFKQFVPHLIVLGIFLLITVAYFSPMLEGKFLRQMDQTHAIGMAKEVQDFEKNNNGEYTAWTNSMFGGMPSYQIKGGPNRSIFVTLQRMLRFNLPFNSMAILFVLLLGFYILMITLEAGPWLGLIGAVAFAFSSYNFVIIEVGHIAKAYALAYMAPVIAGVLMTYRGKILTGGIFTAVALGLEISCNHPQITYYLFLIILALVIVKFIYSVIEKKISQFVKASSVLVVAAILAILPSTTMLWTTYEYGKETIRGKAELAQPNETKASSGLDKDYALDWSYGVAETFTILVPNFQGGD